MRHWVRKPLPKFTRYLIGPENQRKDYCSLLMRLMLFFASKLPSFMTKHHYVLPLAYRVLLINLWNCQSCLLLVGNFVLRLCLLVNLCLVREGGWPQLSLEGSYPVSFCVKWKWLVLLL